jgi:N-acetylglucosaminyl-diphospho-decaprenol L-rhamnosyltransferase
MAAAPRMGVVVATRDRRETLLGTLPRLVGEGPVVVVDNGSSDGSADAVRAAFPSVAVIESAENLGAGARTVGARALATDYVAFADDDSWWAPGALERAVAVFDAHPRLALLAARVLVGPGERLDPVCAAMERSPLRAGDGAPGRPVLGFVACGAIVRRAAYLGVGGFDARYGIGGEERPFAIDLAAAGWELRYVPDVVAHHHPADGGLRPGRRASELRNEVWSAWLHRPARAALRRTAGLVRRSGPRRHTAAGLARALRGAPWVARERRVVPNELERALRALERAEP